MKFSLVIPAYNRGDLIARTLESALGQSLAFGQIIVVDDGSTDNTSTVVAKFGQKVEYIRTPNQGVQMARNTGVAAATFERIAFCDSDDLLDPDFLEVMTEWLSIHPHTDITYTNFSTFDARPWYADKFFAAPAGFFDGVELKEGFYVNDPELYVKSIRYPHMWVTGMTVLKSFYQRIGGFNPAFKGTITEDWEFNLRAIDQGKVALCRRPLARVRYHSGSQSDNTVRTHLGAAKVLEYSMKSHVHAKQFQSEIERIISEHVAKAFNAAFAGGDFDLARQATQSPFFCLHGSVFELKRLIAGLPQPLRWAAWRATQVGSKQ